MFHLARAGWLVWRDQLPETPARPGKGPLSLRVGLDDGSGFDLTEAGTQRKLAVYVVTDPATVPGVAALGPDPMDDSFGQQQFDEILRVAGKAQLRELLRDQKVIAGIGNAYSDEILHAAKLSPFRPASNLTEQERVALFEALKTELRGPPSGPGAGREEIKGTREGPSACTAAPVSRAMSAGNDRRGELRRLVAAVLPCLPDGRQGAG